MNALIKPIGIKTINEIQNEIITSFKILEDDREAMLTYIMELGATNPALDEKYKVDQYLLTGCMSKVWLICQQEEEYLMFKADSNTIITKGLISLLVRIFSGQRAKDIVHANLYFIDEIGIKQLFGFQRINGLFQMLKQLKSIAMYYFANNKFSKKLLLA